MNNYNVVYVMSLLYSVRIPAISVDIECCELPALKFALTVSLFVCLSPQQPIAFPFV